MSYEQEQINLEKILETYDIYMRYPWHKETVTYLEVERCMTTNIDNTNIYIF